MRAPKFSLVLPVALLLVGCVSNQATDTLEVAVNEQIEQRLMSDYELILKVSSQLDHSNIYDQSMQPKNQREKCLLPFLVNNDAGSVALYWDGECHNGYATGLGRVVRTDHGKKTTELLVEFKPDEPDTIYTYLTYSLLREESEVGVSVLKLADNKLQGYGATLGYSLPGWSEGNFDLSYRYEDTSNFVSYTKIIDLLNGESSLIIAYPNFSHDLMDAHDNVLSSFERTYRLLEGNDMVGLSYIWLKDGRLLVRNNATGEDHVATSVSPKLLDYITRIKEQVESKTDAIDDEINLGLNKLEQYHAKKCQRPRAFFRGDEVNFVCSYLEDTQVALEALAEAKDERTESLESYLQHQEQILKELEEHLKTLRPTNLATN